MNKLSKSLTFGFVLTLIFLLPLHAQTATTAPDTKTAAASPDLNEQAPDEVTNKITALVHAGKYAEAQKLTAGLLMAYPNDPRLIKAKALLEKLLAAPAASTGTQAHIPANAANPEPLTGMDKVDYNALIELARQAQQTTDLAEQENLLRQFMEQSDLFLQKHPAEMLLWQLRAASAISLNEPIAGYKAGQQLLALGAADSNDPNLQSLLGRLKNKAWLDKDKAEELQQDADRERQQAQSDAEAARLKEEHDKYTYPVRLDRKHGGLGFYTVSYGFGHLTINEHDLVYDGSDGHIQFSSGNVREIKAYTDSGCFTFVLKDGKIYEFMDTSEEAVTDQKLIALPPGTPLLGKAVLERWKFVSDAKNNTTLKPPIP